MSYARALPAAAALALFGARSGAALRPLGEVDAWNHLSAHTFSEKDVYVLRLVVTGADVRGPEDALYFVRAAGKGQDLKLDVRGVALLPFTTASSWMADIVMTSAGTWGWSPTGDDAETMAAKFVADPDLRAVFPTIRVIAQLFGRLAAPADAIDHWRSQPILWDHALGPLGGPTDTFAHPAAWSVVKGKADDGRLASPWLVTRPPLVAPPAPATAPDGAKGSNGLFWALGIVAAGFVGLHFVR